MQPDKEINLGLVLTGFETWLAFHAKQTTWLACSKHLDGREQYDCPPFHSHYMSFALHSTALPKEQIATAKSRRGC